MCPLNITIEPAEHDEYGSDHEQSSSGDPRDPRHDWSTYTTDRRYWEEHRPARDSIAGRPVTVPRGSDRRVDIKVVENLEECLEDGWLLKAQPAETQRSRRDSHERVKPPLGLNPWNNTLKPYNRFEGGRCKNDVNGLPCWESTMKTDIVLRSRIEALLASEHSRLFAKRYPLISYGIFLLGSRSDARPSIVISVRDDQFKLVATTVFPRSSIPLQHLYDNDSPNFPVRQGPASRSSIDSLTGSGQTQQRSVDVFVDHYLSPPTRLLLPARIRVALPKSGPQAVLGGLISLRSRGKRYGLTIAHTIRDLQIPISLDLSEVEPSYTKIGSVVLSSEIPVIGGLDWALVEIDPDINLSTLAPYPLRVADRTDSPVDVLLKTARGHSDLTRGSLSPTPYFIRADGEDDQGFLETYTVLLNRPILSGDSGAWVLDANTQEFYGHIAFGHPTDMIAYMLSAQGIFRHIENIVSDDVDICASGPGYSISYVSVRDDNPSRQPRPHQPSPKSRHLNANGEQQKQLHSPATTWVDKKPSQAPGYPESRSRRNPQESLRESGTFPGDSSNTGKVTTVHRPRPVRDNTKRKPISKRLPSPQRRSPPLDIVQSENSGQALVFRRSSDESPSSSPTTARGTTNTKIPEEDSFERCQENDRQDTTVNTRKDRDVVDGAPVILEQYDAEEVQLGEVASARGSVEAPE